MENCDANRSLTRKKWPISIVGSVFILTHGFSAVTLENLSLGRAVAYFLAYFHGLLDYRGETSLSKRNTRFSEVKRVRAETARDVLIITHY